MERNRLPREGRPVVKSHFVWTRFRMQAADGAVGGTPSSRWTSAGLAKEEKPENETELKVKPSERPDSAAERG